MNYTWIYELIQLRTVGSSILTYTAGSVPSPHTADPKLTRPTWTPSRMIALPESPLQLSRPSSIIVQNLECETPPGWKCQYSLHNSRSMMSLSTLLRWSGSVPFSNRPHPATVIAFPSGQTSQQSVLQSGEIGVGTTFGQPSRGLPV